MVPAEIRGLCLSGVIRAVRLATLKQSLRYRSLMCRSCSGVVTFFLPERALSFVVSVSAWRLTNSRSSATKTTCNLALINVRHDHTQRDQNILPVINVASSMKIGIFELYWGWTLVSLKYWRKLEMCRLEHEWPATYKSVKSPKSFKQFPNQIL